MHFSLTFFFHFSILIIQTQYHQYTNGVTIEIWVQIILCCEGCSVDYRIFSSFLSLYLLGATSKPPPLQSGIAEWPWGDRVTPG